MRASPLVIDDNIVPVVLERQAPLLPTASPAPILASPPKPGHASDAGSRTEEGASVISLSAGSRIWLLELAEKLSPLAVALNSYVLEARKVHADDTPVPV